MKRTESNWSSSSLTRKDLWGISQQSGTSQKLRPAKFAALTVLTVEGGFNGGRSYCCQIENDRERDKWVSVLTSEVAKVKRAAELEEHGSGLARLRVRVRMMYKSTTSMCFFANVIVASFVVSLAEAQLKLASSSHLSTVFYGAEMSFSGIFFLKLLINLSPVLSFGPFSRHDGTGSTSWL